MTKTLLRMAVVAFGLSSLASATTLSNCVDNDAAFGGLGSILCNLFEEPAAYPLVFTDAHIGPATPGYIVLMDTCPSGPCVGPPSGTPDQQNTSLWSDVLWFQANADFGTGSTLLSFISDSTFFPDYSTVSSFAGSFFIMETVGGGPTIWDPNGDGSFLYIMNSPEFQTPEPASATLIGLGLIGLGGCVFLRRRRSALL